MVQLQLASAVQSRQTGKERVPEAFAQQAVVDQVRFVTALVLGMSAPHPLLAIS